MPNFLLLFTIVLGATAIAPGSFDGEGAYKMGKEYVYHYEGHVVSGIPLFTAQLSGVKVKATVTIHVIPNDVMVMKLSDIALLAVNGVPVTDMSPIDVLPATVFTPLAGPEVHAAITHLAMPIKFVYKKGMVADLEASPAEKYWSVNIKRAILNILKVDLKTSDPSMSGKMPGLSEMLANMAPEVKLATGKVLRSMEEGISGECESIYVIKNMPATATGAAPVMHVTKVRNLFNCRRHPIYQFGILRHLIPVKPWGEHIINTFIHVHYVMQGTVDNFIVRTAILKSRHIITAFDHAKHAPTTFVNQKIALADIKDAATKIPLPATLVKKAALELELPDPILDAAEILAMPAAVVKAKVMVIEELLGEIVKRTPETKETPSYIIKVIEIAKTLPMTDLKRSVIDKYAAATPAHEEMMIKKEIIFDIIPYLNRPDVAELVEILVRDNVITPARAAIMVHYMVMMNHPTPKLVENLITIARSPVVHPHAIVRKACILGVGILADHLQVHQRVANKPKRMIARTKKVIVAEFRRLLGSSEGDKILAVKAIGNSGMTEFIPDLLKVAMDALAPIQHRSMAIYALHGMAKFYPKQIQDLVLPIFIDPWYPREVRVAAFIMAMETEPGLGALQVIAHSLKNETSTDMASFVYSYLHAVGTEKKTAMAKRVHKVLQIITPVEAGIMFSKEIILEKFIGVADIAIIRSLKSAIPHAIVVRLRADILGHMIDPLQVGVLTSGAETVMRNLMGPAGILKDVMSGKMSVADIVGAIKSGAPIAADIQGIMDKVNAIPKAELDKFMTVIYMAIFGHEVDFEVVDKKIIKDIVDMMWKLKPKVVRELLAGYHFTMVKMPAVVDAAMIVPCPAGVALKIDMKAIGIVQVKGFAKVEGVSSLIELFHAPKDIVTKFNIEPSIEAYIHTHMRVEAGPIHAGIAHKQHLYASVPWKTVITHNPVTKKAACVIDIPQKNHLLVKFEAKPVCYIGVIPATVTAKSHVYTEVPIKVKPTIMARVQFHEHVTSEKAFGFYHTAAGHYMKPFVSIDPKLAIMAPVLFSVNVVPGADMPKKFKFKMWLLLPGMTPSAAEIGTFVNGEGAAAGLVAKAEAPSSWSVLTSFLPWGKQTPEAAAPVAPITKISFDPVVIDPSITTPTKVRVLWVFHTVGAKTDHHVASKITHAYSPDLLAHQTHIQIERTPFWPEETTPMKIALDVLYPKLDILFRELPSTFNEKIAHTEFFYGPKAAVTKVMKFEWYLKKMSPGHQIDGLPTGTLPLEIVVDVVHGAKMPELIKKVGAVLRKVVYKLPAYSPKIWLDEVPAANPPGAISVHVAFGHYFKEMFLIVKKPTGTIVAGGLPVPEILKVLPVHHSKGAMFPGECVITANTMKTFAAAVVHVPEVSCEMVITKDCTPHKLFMVTMEPSTAITGMKIIRIYLPKHTVEIIPAHSSVVVKVNKAPMAVVAGTPVIIKEASKEYMKLELVQNTWHIKVIPFGMHVITEGHVVKVHMSTIFHGQVCGFCGIFDGEGKVAFGGHGLPSKEVFKSYLTPSPKCVINAALLDKFKQ